MDDALGHSFAHPALLLLALTHRSLGNESGESGNNERLEFLGDAVLSLVVSEMLYARYPDANEGVLSRLRASIVNASSLSAKAIAARLGERLRLSQGEETTGGRQKPSLLADAYEALLGAIHLDGGFAASSVVIRRQFEADVRGAGLSGLDPKTELQEWCQKHYHVLPEYRMANERGPEHAREFDCEVVLNGGVLGQGFGRSKKLAEQAAARAALTKLSSENE